MKRRFCGLHGFTLYNRVYPQSLCFVCLSGSVDFPYSYSDFAIPISNPRNSANPRKRPMQE